MSIMKYLKIPFETSSFLVLGLMTILLLGFVHLKSWDSETVDTFEKNPENESQIQFGYGVLVTIFLLIMVLFGIK